MNKIDRLAIAICSHVPDEKCDEMVVSLEGKVESGRSDDYYEGMLKTVHMFMQARETFESQPNKEHIMALYLSALATAISRVYINGKVA